jgi:hypothetical protein
MMHRSTTAAAVAALALTGACAPAGAMDGTSPSALPAAVVRVENRNWLDMNVYVVQGSSRIRLGMVTSMNTQTFRVPGMMLRNPTALRLLADPIGGRNGYVSHELMVRPGEQVAMMVHNAVAMSSVAVWGGR